jgi:hypothetical protein
MRNCDQMPSITFVPRVQKNLHGISNKCSGESVSFTVSTSGTENHISGIQWYRSFRRRKNYLVSDICFINTAVNIRITVFHCSVTVNSYCQQKCALLNRQQPALNSDQASTRQSVTAYMLALEVKVT